MPERTSPPISQEELLRSLLKEALGFMYGTGSLSLDKVADWKRRAEEAVAE